MCRKLQPKRMNPGGLLVKGPYLQVIYFNISIFLLDFNSCSSRKW